jgi:hypothetical protein
MAFGFQCADARFNILWRLCAGWRRAKLCGVEPSRLSETQSFALRQPR